MPALTELIVDSNQLTLLPDFLGQAPVLTELSVSGNQLTSLPDSLGQAPALIKLYAGENQLISLPESLGNLQTLRVLNLRYNQLTSLPPQLLELHPDCRIDITGNPLSEQVIADLNALVEERMAQGLTVPHMDFNRHVARAGGIWGEASDLAQARPLVEAVAPWFAAGSSSSVGSAAGAAELPDAVRTPASAAGEGAQALSRLLDRLSGSAEFQNATIRPALQTRVRELLLVVAESPDLLARCNAAALEGLGSCGDRVALSFDNLELQLRLHAVQGQAQPQQQAALLTLGAGAHRREVLQEVTQAKLSTCAWWTRWRCTWPTKPSLASGCCPKRKACCTDILPTSKTVTTPPPKPP